MFIWVTFLPSKPLSNTLANPRSCPSHKTDTLLQWTRHLKRVWNPKLLCSDFCDSKQTGQLSHLPQAADNKYIDRALGSHRLLFLNKTWSSIFIIINTIKECNDVNDWPLLLITMQCTMQIGPILLPSSGVSAQLSWPERRSLLTPRVWPPQPRAVSVSVSKPPTPTKQTLGVQCQDHRVFK